MEFSLVISHASARQKKIIAWKMIENHFSLINHTAFATISQLLRYFRTQLSIPKCSLPQELMRGRLELYSLHSMPQQGTI